MNVATIQEAIREAKEAAYQAAHDFEQKHFPNKGWGACGFAWVDIYEHEGAKIKGNTKMGRLLMAAGI